MRCGVVMIHEQVGMGGWVKLAHRVANLSLLIGRNAHACMHACEQHTLASLRRVLPLHRPVQHEFGRLCRPWCPIRSCMMKKANDVKRY